MRSLVLIFFILLTLSCFTSCRKSEEIQRFELSEEDVNFVPYRENSSVPFKHSAGLEFPLEVRQRRIFWDQTEIEHHGDNYNSYQVEETLLVSTEPQLEITLLAYPEEFMPALDLNINRFSFTLHKSANTPVDRLTINSKVYRDVFIIKNEYTDPGKIVPDSVFYTKNEGIISIKMTNNEQYYLNR